MIGDQEPRLDLAPRMAGGGVLVAASAAVLPGPADPTADRFVIQDPDGWTDALTGCDGPRFWDRMLASEQARNLRHNRTATVALIEFAGMEKAARAWGAELATQLFRRLANALTGGIRSSDHIARIGPTRFGVLLVETDEVLAINFVDRVRARCSAEVDPDLHGFQIGIGWASPAPGGRLGDAHRIAVDRLEADLVRLG